MVSPILLALLPLLLQKKDKEKSQPIIINNIINSPNANIPENSNNEPENNSNEIIPLDWLKRTESHLKKTTRLNDIDIRKKAGEIWGDLTPENQAKIIGSVTNE